MNVPTNPEQQQSPIDIYVMKETAGIRLGYAALSASLPPEDLPAIERFLAAAKAKAREDFLRYSAENPEPKINALMSDVTAKVDASLPEDQKGKMGNLKTFPERFASQVAEFRKKYADLARNAQIQGTEVTQRERENLYAVYSRFTLARSWNLDEEQHVINHPENAMDWDARTQMLRAMGIFQETETNVDMSKWPNDKDKPKSITGSRDLTIARAETPIPGVTYEFVYQPYNGANHMIDNLDLNYDAMAALANSSATNLA